MYKVIIVDDEPIIKRGLVEIIDWEKYGCRVCATASDGVTGAELIRKHLPDIIFTDIRMKNMTGLAMIKEIKDVVPHAKVIILTAYSEFDYAQQAVALLVFRFLLKPLHPESIEKVVGEAVEAIAKEKSYSADYTSEEKFLFENAVFTDIADNIRENTENIHNNLSKYNISLNRFYIGIFENAESHKNTKLIKDSLLDLFDKHLMKINFLSTAKSKDLCVIFRDNTEIPVSLNTICELLEGVFSFAGNECYIFLSSCGMGFNDIPKKIEECLSIIELNINIHTNEIICFDDIALIKKNDFINKREKIVSLIANGEIELLQDYINLFSSSLINISDSRLIRILCWDLIFAVCKINESTNGNANYNTLSLYNLIRKSKDISEMIDLVSTTSFVVAKKAHERSNNERNIRLDMAIDYINNHYSENITRTLVAKNIFISPSYLSFIFKENLSISFSDYLIEVRIKKSEELLKDHNIKISNIASMVGIDDPQYFSKVFRKINGTTPSAYRKKYT